MSTMENQEMYEEKLALEAQNTSLQLLVRELLLTNERLRRELSQECREAADGRFVELHH